MKCGLPLETSELRIRRTLLMALRYYFDVVCPYSYIMGFEVEEAEDDALWRWIGRPSS